MPSIVAGPVQADERLLDRARTDLGDLFGVPIEFWWGRDGWSRLPSSVLDDRSEEVLDSSAELGVESLLDDAWQRGEPRCWETSDGVLLAVPLPDPTGNPLAATVSLAGVPAEHLLRAADYFRRSFEVDQQFTGVRQENDAFLRQVTNDFEELTYLRGMADMLEIADLSFDFTAMAGNVLPTLRPLLGADTLVLIKAAAPAKGAAASSTAAVVDSLLWEGKRAVDEAVCTGLVERYRVACKSQPVVKNNFQSMQECAGFPGVESFILVPVVHSEVAIGWLLALNRNNEWNLFTEQLPWEISYVEFGTHEATLMSSTAAILATHARNVELFREREQLLFKVVQALVSAIEARDEYTRGHSERVALFARQIGKQCGLSESELETLYLSGLLHDIGKIGIADAVLRKPGKLTDEEFAEVQQHPDKGWAILADLGLLSTVLPGMLHHHEQYDGRGYPDRLKGDEIPVNGRILAVADSYDAMTSDRPYRKGMPQEKAEGILRSGSGTQWDPAVIDAFFRAVPEIVRIRETYQPRIQPKRKPNVV